MSNEGKVRFEALGPCGLKGGHGQWYRVTGENDVIYIFDGTHQHRGFRGYTAYRVSPKNRNPINPQGFIFSNAPRMFQTKGLCEAFIKSLEAVGITTATVVKE